MTAPKYAPTWNVTTILAIANLAILIFMGGGAFFALRAETQALREHVARLESADVQIRLDAAAREARLRTVEQLSGRFEAQLDSIESGIESGIERLSAQLDRIIEERP